MSWRSSPRKSSSRAGSSPTAGSEGPFGEYSGYYAALHPVVEVTAVTHRRNPIFHAGLTGRPMTENHFLKELPSEAALHRYLKPSFPGLKSVHATGAGCCAFIIFISVQQTFLGEGRKVLMAAIGSEKPLKYVVVCDEDIDVFGSVLWAPPGPGRRRT